jgi:aspartate kinase
VARDQAAEALRIVHRVFELEKEPEAPPRPAPTAPKNGRDALAIVSSLQGMEDISISDILLDESQARVTITGVPDRPGVAAQVFEEIARAGIFVDMIVQSYGREGRASITFTVRQAELARSVELAGAVGKSLGCGPVSSSPRVAKISVFGIGIRSHSGGVIRMFQALATAGINVEMISTSEVRVNLVVSGEHGQAGLKCLQEAFREEMR